MFIKPAKKSYFSFNSINFYCDFETILVNGIHYVSCFSIVGHRISYYKSLGIVSSSNIKYESNKLVLDFIQICFDLILNLNIKPLFFFHNFNKFDSFFILGSLSNSKKYDIKLITRNRIVYKMVILDLKNNLNIEFRDTYLLLNISLEKIGHIFCQQYKKIKFNFLLNKLENYSDKKLFFDLRQKIEIYCLNDSLVLKEGFERYLKNMKKLLFINPLLCLSLPSLAMKLFLTSYYDLKKGQIENCSGNKEIFIRKSYKGGVVDVFKPHLIDGYHYDINSLYPYVMKEFEYPIGSGVFISSSDIDLNSFFGFLEVEVHCPASIKIPLLPKYDKFRGLICPTGSWKDIYFSEELKVAKTLGYTFKILRGVSYSKKKMFVDIIDNLYNIRIQYSKSSPINVILKLLMNSLYGRFGMKSFLPTTQLVNENEYNEIQAIYDVLDQTVLNEKILVVYIKKPVLKKLNLLLKLGLLSEKRYNLLKKESENKLFFTPIQLASAITSYARIIIYKYKSDPNNEIYYSDTDSIFCKYPIHKRYLSNTKLGFMKNCGKVKEAYFIAPKIYGCLYSNHFDIKSKGVNKGLVTSEDIKSIYFGESKSYINTLFFKKDYKEFVIRRLEQKINISGIFLKRKKIYKNGKWISTKPLSLPYK